MTALNSRHLPEVAATDWGLSHPSLEWFRIRRQRFTGKRLESYNHAAPAWALPGSTLAPTVSAAR